jgi:hypothetical protein
MFGLDRFLTRKMLAYAVRRGLMIAGAYLVSEGWVEGEVWTQAAPGIALIAADFALSMYDKVQARRTVQAAVDPSRGTEKTDKAIAAAMQVT